MEAVPARIRRRMPEQAREVVDQMAADLIREGIHSHSEVRQGGVVIRKMMNLSSSFDHRVVDGMHAAQFVQAIRALLECPALLFVE